VGAEKVSESEKSVKAEFVSRSEFRTFFLVERKPKKNNSGFSLALSPSSATIHNTFTTWTVRANRTSQVSSHLNNKTTY